MKLLFVASRFPYPPLQGDRVRAYHQLQALSHEHDIVLVTPEPQTNREQGLETVNRLCTQVEIVSVSPWRRLLRLAPTPFSSLPLQTLYFFDPRFQKRVKSLLTQQPFDLIHVQLVRMAPVADGLEGIPTVIDLIDALSVNMSRRAQRERGPMAWIVGKEAKRLQKYERELTKQYDQLLISSPQDREAIGEYDNIHVIRNGVDIADYPIAEGDHELDRIVFTGRMGYFPNADAAVWFTTEVLPLVRSQVPQARFFIVGADPTPAVRRLAEHAGVIVTGYVPSIQDFLTKSTVAVAPMKSGSGMQFKVLEAMACGTPVVATSYALGGIEATDGKHLLIASNAESFADNVIRLMESSTLRQRLAHNARSLVEAKYTWERSVAMLEEVYRLALDKGGFSF
jgi:sugar transferase (PEP-CTERM/EpsH1 system associated)